MDNSNLMKRNLIIYSLGVLLVATLGGLVTASGNELGGLIFILSPILLATALRFFGGDGWKDAGLGLQLKQSWRWYLLALLAFPVSMALIVAAGMLLGVTTLNLAWPEFFTALLSGMAAQILPRLIFSAFEEWGWRGYMEPRLGALGVPDLQRHLTVGLVWGLWHFPLILSTDYTQVPYVVFLPAFLLGVTVQAVVYGQIRKASGTVWTAVLLHGIGNTVAWALLQGNLLTINSKMLAYFAPESLFSMLLWGGLGAYLLLRRRLQ